MSSEDPKPKFEDLGTLPPDGFENRGDLVRNGRSQMHISKIEKETTQVG